MALPRDDARACTEPLGFVERATRVVETFESDQCERTAELRIGKIRSPLEDRIVLHEGR
jgi:hypothetical protein